MLESKRTRREIFLKNIREIKGSSVGKYWAPPKFWSPWYEIDSVINGAWKYTLTAETVSGSSSFDAQVTYFWEGNRKTGDFGVLGSTTFYAGGRQKESAFKIRVRFRSHSLGQTIRLRVDRTP